MAAPGKLPTCERRSRRRPGSSGATSGLSRRGAISSKCAAPKGMARRRSRHPANPTPAGRRASTAKKRIYRELRRREVEGGKTEDERRRTMDGGQWTKDGGRWTKDG